MDTFFAVIIGAGPGGLACARLLAGQGFSVLVLEKKSVVGPKTCAGGITWSGLKNSVPPRLCERSFPEQHLRTDWQRCVIRAREPIVATIGREQLGDWMRRRAEEAGAAVMTATRVCRIEGRYIETERGRFGYRHLVGADGSKSLVRRYLQLPSERFGIGMHFRVPGNFENMEWHLRTRLFGSGYGWIFPHRDWASIGAYADNRTIRPGNLLAALRQWTAAMDIDLSGLTPRAGLVNFDFRGWRFKNRYLVGDAAGLASALTGEGILPAVVSGETAARTIIDPDYEPAALNRLIARHGKHLRLLDFCSRGGLLCSAAMELLVLSMRSRLLSFHALEMTH